MSRGSKQQTTLLHTNSCFAYLGGDVISVPFPGKTSRSSADPAAVSTTTKSAPKTKRSADKAAAGSPSLPLATAATSSGGEKTVGVAPFSAPPPPSAGNDGGASSSRTSRNTSTSANPTHPSGSERQAVPGGDTWGGALAAGANKAESGNGKQSGSGVCGGGSGTC